MEKEIARKIKVGLKKSNLIEFYKLLYARLYGGKIIANSVPKSGTYLLNRIFLLLPQIYNRQKITGVPAEFPLSGQCNKLRSFFSFKQMEDCLKRTKKGQYFLAHMKYREDFASLLVKYDFKHFLIIRDPRDVAVSWLHWNMSGLDNKHPRKSYYLDYPDDDTRLLKSITGFRKETDKGTVLVPSIYERFSECMPWLSDKNCCVVRFEKLIGEKGGGNDKDQLQEFKRIIEHLNIEIPEKKILKMLKKIFYTKSNTFRKGQIGDWKNHFKDKHKQVFKEISGEILIELEYERYLNW